MAALMDMEPSIALIADGRLILARMDGQSKRHDCEFAAEIERREQRSAEKNSWLQGEEGAGGMNPFGRSSVWGRRSMAGPSLRPQIVAVEGGERPGSMVYALWTGVVGAVLEYDFEEGYERRVFHRERFHASEFDRHPDDGRLVCRFGEPMSSSLAVLDADGRNARAVTEGDSIDAAPSWVPGGEAVVYHSAGLSRDPNGAVRGLGPSSIHRIDLKSGELETLVEYPEKDLLSPRADVAGNLYYIRRNYEGPHGVRPPLWVTLKDAVLFPFRIIRAMVDFFQIFSMMVSKKPLTSAGGPKAQGPEPVRMWIYGRMIDVQKASAANGPDGALAPADWELVKRSPDGTETVMAKHVLAYDIAKDGRIAWSDGKNLHLVENGAKKKLLSEPLIDAVKWLEPLDVQA
ncbi:hypothetical protein [Haloferula sp. BvORR071]|uniref:TolB family protein n=1 Tax=Haloferula sp. BvORR071 TaxID=1396141 RepID=UPI0005536C59|nr:hypothetical protein [Haloferula sp. BvORR071]